MRLFILSLILSLFALHGVTQAQTFHFSQYQMTPHLLNPALTGNFYGTMRLGVIYRNQWSGIMNGYSTPSFFLDAPVAISFGKHDWIGAGGVVVQDRAGSARLSTGGFLFSGAYHKGFGNAGKNVISLGLQYGVMSRRIRDVFGLRFYDAIEAGAGGTSLDLDKIANDNQRNNHFAVGLTYTYKYSQDEHLQFGLSASNLSRRGGNVSLLSGGGGYFLRPHFVGFGSFDKKVTERIIARPSAMFQLMDKNFEMVVQAVGGLIINPDENIVLNLGLGYRVGDSGMILGGMDYKTFRVGIAYDINLGKLGAANGFELGVTYIIRIIKRPKVRPVIFCPRL